MKRILHINSTVVINSGVMHVIMNYYRHIDRSKFQFDFVYFSKIRENYISFEKEIENLGGRVYYIPDFTKFKSFNEKLKALIIENKYDIVHIHDPFVCRFVNKTLRECGIKHIICHSHATKWSDKKISSIRNYLVCRNLDKFIDYKFACSMRAGEFLYGKKSDFFLLNNAVDTEKYAFNEETRGRLRRELGIEDGIVFGHVGNFVRQKNHEFLLRIFEAIMRREPKSFLLLLGEGPLRKSIEELAAGYPFKDRIIFLGKRDNVEDYYQVMDSFILPSLYEGLPMVGVESQVSGLPVLFSDTITREVGLWKNEFLSLNTSPDLWAERAIEFSKSVSFDDRYRAKDLVGERGFDIKNVTKKLEEKYLSMN